MKIFGIPVVEDDSLPDDEIHLVAGVPVVRQDGTIEWDGKRWVLKNIGEPYESVAPPTQSERTESRLSDECLEEIERRFQAGCHSHEITADSVRTIDYLCTCFEDIAETGLSLVAEIRRLRRENHLLNLSRGVPRVGEG